MELSKQVVSLDLARKLKELGVKQEALYFWVFWDDTVHRLQGTPNGWKLEMRAHRDCESYAAFTVAELGEMLPSSIDARSKKDGRKLISYYLSYDSAGLVLCYSHHLDIRQVLCETASESEAEARGLMLAYLIENKLVIL